MQTISFRYNLNQSSSMFREKYEKKKVFLKDVCFLFVISRLIVKLSLLNISTRRVRFLPSSVDILRTKMFRKSFLKFSII